MTDRKSETAKSIENMAPDQLAATKALIDAESRRRSGDVDRVGQMGNQEFEQWKDAQFAQADRARRDQIAASQRAADEAAAAERAANRD